MTHEEAEVLRRDPAHWTLAIFYRCPADPRVIVRDRFLPGWTFNFGHRLVAPTITAFALFACAPVLGLLTAGIRHWPTLLTVAALCAAVLLTLAHRIASGPR